MAAVGGIFLGREGAAQHDGRAEEAEVGFRDVDAVNLLGDGAGEVEAGTAEVVGGDILNDAGLGSPGIEVDRGGAIAVAIGKGVHELDHAVGFGIGERLEQDGVDDGEDGGVGSDAEGESGDGGDGECRVGDEHAEGVAEVLPRKSFIELSRLRSWELGRQSARLAQSTVRLGRTASRCDGWLLWGAGSREQGIREQGAGNRAQKTTFNVRDQSTGSMEAQGTGGRNTGTQRLQALRAGSFLAQGAGGAWGQERGRPAVLTLSR